MRQLYRSQGDRRRLGAHQQPERHREDRGRPRSAGRRSPRSELAVVRDEAIVIDRNGESAQSGRSRGTGENRAPLSRKPGARSRSFVARYGPRRRGGLSALIDPAAREAPHHRRNRRQNPERSARGGSSLKTGTALKFMTQGVEAT